MQADIYGTLYSASELDMAIPMVKNLYAKKPEPRAAEGK